jgi:hypothetical protein
MRINGNMPRGRDLGNAALLTLAEKRDQLRLLCNKPSDYLLTRPHPNMTKSPSFEIKTHPGFIWGFWMPVGEIAHT